MAAILKTIFSNSVSVMKIFVVWLEFNSRVLKSLVDNLHFASLPEAVKHLQTEPVIGKTLSWDFVDMIIVHVYEQNYIICYRDIVLSRHATYGSVVYRLQYL